MAKASPKVSAEYAAKLALYEKLVATNPAVERKGVTMAEYVAVPDALLAKTSELKPFFERSYRYIATLKPKPTTRPQKKSQTSGATKAAKPRKLTKRAKG
jgi:TfoX/Sxy family transcriptional regulator of competence genes